jgi:ADP-heptose:LPS heptosyltransferase
MRSLLFRLCYVLLRALRPSAASPDAAPVVLMLQYQTPLGCCVHSTPLIAALHESIRAQHADAKLIVATRGMGAQVLAHDPHVTHLLVTSDPSPSLLARWRVAREIRRQLSTLGMQPTLIVQDATNRAGSNALLSAMVALAPTAGFADAPELYDTHLDYDRSQSLIDNNLRLVALVRSDCAHREPGVHFTTEELAATNSLLAQLQPDATRIAFVMQGSGGQRTGWHDDRFAQVLRHVSTRYGRPIFLGTAADVPLIKRIEALAAVEGLSLAGRTTVPQLAALLTQCDLLVSLDTGTLHVGRAAGVPLVVLGPCWQPPGEWLPMQLAHARILRGPDRGSVPPEYRLDEIEPGAVIAAIDELLRLYPAAVDSRTARAQRLLSQTRA